MEHTSSHQQKYKKQEVKQKEASITSANKTSTFVPETQRSKIAVGTTK
jgi:hypothetical protein